MADKYAKDELGSRMKTYEVVTQNHVMRRSPVIIRLDGKAFHTFTKQFNKDTDPSMELMPFSVGLHNIMYQTMMTLCDKLHNVRVGYTQSDEISILLTDWTNLKTEPWYNANVQKMVSISAGIASAYFNYYYMCEMGHLPAKAELAIFDSRVFNLPKEEVNNYFVWRQQDATRNSVNMLGQHYFSHKELQGVNVKQVQEKLFTEHGVNWNDIPTWAKRGSCYHPSWILNSGGALKDKEIPVFTQNDDYIGHYVY